MAISLPRPVSTMSKRFIYEDFTHYEGMIRVPKTDPRLTPHPDTYVDGIFRWPHTPEFSEPLNEQLDTVWYDATGDFPMLDLEKPSPYMGDWQMVRHMLYFLGGFTALFILSDKFGISRREKIIATPPEFPYSNYIETGGQGSAFENAQFGVLYPESFQKWFLEQAQHPDNADFKGEPEKWAKKIINHDAHGHDAHGHDAHGHDAHGHDAHGHHGIEGLKPWDPRNRPVLENDPRSDLKVPLCVSATGISGLIYLMFVDASMKGVKPWEC